MIPKIIHYCWFGNGEKSALTLKCIQTWKQYMPEYQIIEWNETNIDIENEVDYVREAYAAKKYAFVSDYVRIKQLFEYGGIYFDTDYELINSIEKYIEGASLVTGFEYKNILLTAMIAVEKNNRVIKELLEEYKSRHFILNQKEMDLTPINNHFSRIIQKYGIDLERDEYQCTDERIIVYPKEVFCGFDMDNWHEKVTAKTTGIHHMNSSWVSDRQKKYFKRIRKIQAIIGLELYDYLKMNIYDRIKHMIKKYE